jgi:hypothetical protein
MRPVKPGHKIISRFRSALTVALVLWCAGAGCMIVSYAHGVAMGEPDVAGGSGAVWNASGSIEAHHCCKSRQAPSRHVSLSKAAQAAASKSVASLKELSEVPNSSGVMSCCPLTSGSIVSSGRQRLYDDASVSPVDAVSTFHNGSTTTTHARPLRLPNQSHTYLRGCIFLI